MGMYTYLSDSDKKNYTKVSHKELNELLQEVRQLMPDLYVSEYTRTYKFWFKKSKTKTFYSVYHDNGYDARVLNLNFSTEAHVYNYLCGFMNGYNYLEKQNNQNEKLS